MTFFVPWAQHAFGVNMHMSQASRASFCVECRRCCAQAAAVLVLCVCTCMRFSLYGFFNFDMLYLKGCFGLVGFKVV